MTNSQTVESILSSRIASAYQRLWPRVGCEFSIAKASMAAVATLLKAHLDDEELPLDPELFVRSQAKRSRGFSPWFDLVSPAALRAYRGQVRKIVASLHNELLWEMDRAESRIADGASVSKVLIEADCKFTGLARYILAQRFHRYALSGRFLHEAAAQHRACPLYRQATVGLLAPELYPDESLLRRSRTDNRPRCLQNDKEGASLAQWN